ncbi:unnamed protein product [Urochloa humidicola]
MGIPKVELRGLEEPGVPGWEEARAAVAQSMGSYGCVVVAHDALGPEVKRALFCRAMPELFELPLETKQRNVSTNGPYTGYVGELAGMAYESVCVAQTAETGSVRVFDDIFWPDNGNQEFCDTITYVATNMLKLVQTVEKMTLESLGVREENIGSYLGMLTHVVRLSYYGELPATETSSVSLMAHRDTNMLTTIVQHEVEGLEVQAKDGSWLSIPPEPDTFTFVAGDLFTVLTNGRVPACIHRVRTPSNRKRFSLVFSRWSSGDTIVSAMDELVDSEHPLMYNPCRFDQYRAFRYSDGFKFSDPLKAFCGVKQDESTEP